MAVYKIRLPTEDTVYYINDYLNKIDNQANPTKVLAWGYPAKPTPKVLSQSPTKGIGAVLNNTFKQPFIIWKGGKKDSLNYLVAYNTNSTLTLGPGFSGSPIFYCKSSLENGMTIDRYYWGGVLFGGTPQFAFVLKPNVVKRQLQKQIDRIESGN